MTPEGRVKKAARAMARSYSCIWTVSYNETGLSANGVPDDLLVVHGQFVAVEFKAHMRWDSNKKSCLRTLPTLLQCRQMELIRGAGGITLVVDDRGLALYEALLKELADCTALLDSRAVLRRSYLTWLWSVRYYMEYRETGSAEAAALLSFPDDDRAGVPVCRKDVPNIEDSIGWRIVT